MRWLRILIYQLERLILKGASFQLLFIGGMIVLVSLASGTILYLTQPEAGGFFESVWWGFLRLSDPGYLGDDEGLIRRSLSTLVTILGYVLFMGALVATMTQGLYRTMHRLEAGLTPISLKGHILILGWTNRTPAIIREILLAQGRVRRFLRRAGVRRLRIVVLAEEVTSSLVADLKSELGPLWQAEKIIFRSGNPLKTDHLERADFLRASSIILPASEFELSKGESFDARVVKVLLSISKAASRAGARPPLLVTETQDPRKAELLERGYEGDARIIPSSLVISRLIAQNVRHSGLSFVHGELLNHARGNEIYLREAPVLTGKPFGEAGRYFPRAVVLGVIRQDEDGLRPVLNPPQDLRLLEGDRLVLVAANYGATEAVRNPLPPGEGSALAPLVRRSGLKRRRVLILGWSSKLPILLSEFDSYAKERFEIDLVSVVPAAQRQQLLKGFASAPCRQELRHIEADYTSPSAMVALDPGGYDNILFLSSDWMQSGTESDARTILGYQLLRLELERARSRPEIILELMDPENENLFPPQAGEVLVSPLIISHMLGHTALRPELAMVFEELFTAGGAEIYFSAASDYLEPGRNSWSFAEISSEAARRGDVALGLFRPRPGKAAGEQALVLNPPKDSRWELGEQDRLVVLTTYEQSEEREEA